MSALVAAAVAVCWLAAGASCEQAGGAGEVGDSPLAAGLRVAAAAYRQCRSGGHLLACLQLKALKAADRALAADRVPLLEGVELVRTGAGRGLQGEGATPLDEERLWGQPGRLGALLVDRAASLLDSHALRIHVPRLLQLDDVSENEVDEGRKKKKNKMMGGLLMMMGMMKAGMMALGMKAVALLAGKALIVAKVALVLAAVLGISKLVGGGGGGGGGGGTTYEVVSHPHVSHAHTYSSSHDLHDAHGGGGGGGGGGGHFESSGGGGGGGGGHWGRSLGGGDPHPLAYRGHAAAAGGIASKSMT